MAGNKFFLSVVTIAHNEEKRIEDCLKSTQGWADEHIVVDDFSADRTVELARKYTDKVFQRRMDIEGVHRNWAYQKAKNEWVLSLDADEAVTEGLKKEIAEAISQESEFNAYSIPLRTYIGDYWVRHGGWYPAGKLRLFKKSKFKYEEVGVHPCIILDGKCGHLKKDIIHKGYADFADLFYGLNRQTDLEAEKWYNENRKIGIAKMLWKACDRFFRSYVRKQGFRDGIVGFVIAVHGAFYQIMSYAKYWELKRTKKEEL
ncbi:MAG: glycosyltransferase family 2 protein [Candidatus Omnitrophica bacterium]|nr:glycosyltransferase family 2 protein [Candidatus Omnitrophota bacterium]